jgi:TRAP-type C4-dicarboxylate transport system substrate-binding protein
MNNQFDNLMYEAGLTAQGCWDKMDEYDRTAILKFAELIVREVFDCIADEGFEVYEPVVKAVKQHFGVEESRREKFRKSFEEAFKDGVDLSGQETP